MSESSIKDLFESVPFVPNEDFIGYLRGRVQEEFAADSRTAPPTSSRAVAAEQPIPRAACEGVVSSDMEERRERRGRRPLSWTLFAAAAVIASIVVIRLVSSPKPSTITNTPPTTMHQHAYEQNVNGTLELGGAALGFAGTVELDHADVSATNPADVTLMPVVDLTLHTNGDQPIGVTQVYVQLYFDAGLVDCVVSKGTCAEGGVVTPDLVAPSSVTAQHPLHVATRSSVPLTVHSVADGGDVAQAAAAGSLVAGIAIVAVDDTGSIATQIFDGNGALRVSCSALPDRCMNSERSVLPSSAISTSAVPNAAPQPLPAGVVPPGTYEFKDFIVPFAITTVAAWSGNGSYGSALSVHFVRNAPYSATLTVSRAPSYMTSLDEVFADCASNSKGTTAPEAAVLLGAPARQVDAVAHGDCLAQMIGLGHDGDSARVVAAEIGGQIIVAVASAPGKDWPAFTAEIDKTLASITPLR